METRAVLRGVRLSVDKGRLVADLIRGKKVDQALNTLEFTQKKAAGIIKKVLESAIANAEHNDGADIDELKVSRFSAFSTCRPRIWSATRRPFWGDRRTPFSFAVVSISAFLISWPAPARQARRSTSCHRPALRCCRLWSDL